MNNKKKHEHAHPAGIYLSRVNNANDRTACEIWPQWRRFSVFNMTFVQIWPIDLVLTLLILSK